MVILAIQAIYKKSWSEIMKGSVLTIPIYEIDNLSAIIIMMELFEDKSQEMNKTMLLLVVLILFLPAQVAAEFNGLPSLSSQGLVLIRTSSTCSERPVANRLLEHSSRHQYHVRPVKACWRSLKIWEG